MEITHLLDKLKRTPQEEPEKFFAIQIDAEFVKTAVWTVRNRTTDIIAIGETVEWDGTSTEILLESIDHALTTALEKLPSDSHEPEKVIFGLQESWVTPEGIVSTRLADLKAICEKLALKPLGFVVTTEAISQYLKAKEGTPLSGILLRVSTSEVAVSIVTLGAIEGTHVAGRSGDLAADVREGLARFGERESFPSRMILYNGGEDLADLTQQLLAYDWLSTLPFLHIPKIESVDDTFSITAIAVAGGAEVAKSLGFVIEQSKPAPTATPSEQQLPTAEVDSVVQEQPPPAEQSAAGSQVAVESEKEEIKDTGLKEEPEVQTPVRRRFPSLDVTSLFNKMRSLVRFPWRPRFALPQGTPLTILFVIGIILLITIGVVQAAKRLPRATVRVVLASQRLNERVTISVDPYASAVNAQQRVLPAEKVTISKSKEMSRETTGKKSVGERAKGEITIFNKTNAVKKFTAATTVTGPQGREFTLDNDVSVASQSAQTTETGVTIVYGTATAGVTASDVGPEYNLEPGSEFNISNLSPSAFSGKNDAAFSKGTKQEVQVVGKKDQAELKDSLLSSIKQEASAEIESGVSGKRVFPETVSVTPTEESFSDAIGEEASQVNLSLTAQVMALAFKESDYQDLLVAILQESIPEGFTLQNEKMETTTENIRFENEVVSFDAAVTSVLSPRVTQEEIIDLIAGKRPKQAADAVQAVPHFKRIELSFSPALPPILQWVPSSKNHIAVTITLDE